MENHNNKIRIGLLVDSLKLPAWVYTMLERIKKSDYAEIDLVVLNDGYKSKDYYLDRIIGNREYWLFNLYRRIDVSLFRPNRDAFAIMDAVGLLEGVPVIKVQPERDQYTDLIKARDIGEIKEYKIDVFVRLGFRILKGDILDTPRYGIWSYHHGDSAVLRGGPPGFWEVFENHPVSGATLQILTNELDKGIVLGKTFSSTDMLSVTRNRSNYYWNALSLLPRRLKELHHLGEQRFFDKIRAENIDLEFSPDIRKCPKNGEFIGYFIKKIIELATFKLAKFIFLQQWILMFNLDQGISGPLGNFKKIVPPKDRLWADPFVLYKNNQYYIYLEEMEYNDKGHISLIVMDEQGNYENPVIVLEKPFHLSYPFVFEWQGDCYMIPESGANKTIDAYKCTQFPDKWVFHKTLMKNVKAADATLFFHQDKWWLFVNIQENEGASNWEELYLFYSDNPLSDNWTPHPQNPIVSDVRRSRPAGKIYEQNGNFYRPAQDCSKAYGYGMRINQIVVMNENEYKEVEVRYIEPDWDKDIKGVHTLSKEHKLTVIDAIYKRSLLS